MDTESDRESPKQALKIMESLARLRDMTEKEFPHAGAFKRPGFDDAPVA
ncbi:MAG: hypothetical protein ACLFUL_04280 [Desulfobacteraceae bacterium]